MLRIGVGATIELWDKSEPAGAVTSRRWFIGEQEEFGDSEYIDNLHFQAPGVSSVTLRLNDDPNLEITKWIYVAGDTAKAVPTPYPEISIVTTSRETKSSSLPITASTKNIYDAADIQIVSPKGEKLKFDFSETDGVGELTARLPLIVGENTFQLIAETNVGETRESVVVRRGRKNSSRTLLPPPPPVQKEPTVAFVGGGTTTEASQIDLSFTANNVGQRQLRAMVNGKPFAYNKITLKNGRGKLVGVPIRIGNNDISITATNSAGEDQTSTKIVRKSSEPTESYGEYAITGVSLSAASLGSCEDYSLTSGTLKLDPRRMIRLNSAKVYSSGCGELVVTLAAGRTKVIDVFELTKGKSGFVFENIRDKELRPDISYQLNYTTRPSTNCGGEVAPNLLNAASCDKNSGGDERMGLRYQGEVGVFGLKYLY